MRSSAPGSAVAYGAADRLLHRIALAAPFVLETSFDIERASFGKAAAGRGQRAPLFVCALARAGTSIILRLLHGVGAFASLSYRDLPFPLAPNGWARLTRGTRRAAGGGERGHQDGLEHDLDTPEAIEEIFWRCFEGGHYLRRDGLALSPVGVETIARFRTYVSLIALRYDRPRYLSKNNNNILRLEALATAFPDAVLIHPFRDPEQQAASLLVQHQRALMLHEGDSFRRKFMTWLGHHEFGADQRPFLLPGAPAPTMDAGSPDYWLVTWISVYRHLLEQQQPVSGRQVFLDYEAMLECPDRSAAELASITGIDSSTLATAALRRPAPHPQLGFDRTLLSEARDLHRQLQLRADARRARSPPP